MEVDPGTMAMYGNDDGQGQVDDYLLPDGSDQQPTTSTQLSEQFPQIDTPLRVDPPPSLKAPARVPVLTRDEQVVGDAFAPKAFVLRKAAAASGSGGVYRSPLPPVSTKGTRKSAIDSSLKAFSQNQAPSKNSVSDASMLAFSSARAGKVQSEGAAHLSMAIAHDNMEQYAKAMESYRKFLAVGKKLGDSVAEGLAQNCLGVDAMLQACPPMEGSPFEARRTLSAEARELLQKAATHHAGHLVVADEGGQFVASTNLGLCAGLLGDLAAATAHHQEALRIAIRLQSYSGQGLAVGNLGLMALRSGEQETARACLEQHLQLVQSLKDQQAEANAWTLLGQLADASGDFRAAVECFEGAARIASERREMGLLKRANCLVGIAKGHQDMAAHFARLEGFARTGYGGAAAENS